MKTKTPQLCLLKNGKPYLTAAKNFPFEGGGQTFLYSMLSELLLRCTNFSRRKGEGDLVRDMPKLA